MTFRSALSKSLFLLLSFVSGGVFAQSFEEDCGAVVSALLQIEQKQALLDKVQPLRAGKQKFHVSKTTAPWGGYYFPFMDGGIATRWQMNSPRAYKLLNEASQGELAPPRSVLSKLKQMSADEINRLSPAEKFDIYLGNYDFRVTRTELELRGPRRQPKPEGWEGFCNGRCAAAINLPEPKKPLKVKNKDGIEITFEINDLKALGAADYQYVELYSQMGSPNFSRRRISLDNAPNAGAFDMMVRAYLGEAKRPFLFDKEVNYQVWNSTAIGYERKLAELIPLTRAEAEFAPREASHQIDVILRVDYHEEIRLSDANQRTQELIAKGWPGRNHQIVFEYRLYVDANENIVGGRFYNENRPDFVWFAAGRGADATLGMNPYLDDASIQELFEKAAR